MAQRIVSLLLHNDHQEDFDKASVAEEITIIEQWKVRGCDQTVCQYFLVNAQDVQTFLDGAQPLLEEEKILRVMVATVEASLPLSEREKELQEERKEDPWLLSKISREELYADVVHGATLNANYLLLTFFSTVVGAVSLLDDNVAVLIGAMVIAPLLGPFMALGFALAIGDGEFVKQALKTGALGIGFSLLVSFIIGIAISLPEEGALVDMAKIGYGNVILALCSGVVGVLSLSQPMRSSLVGVMVAVALLPPVIGTGLFWGNGSWNHAAHTALLLIVNIVCIVLTAQLTFTALKIKPQMRSWLQEKNADKTYNRYLGVFSLLLILSLLAVVWIREA